MRRAIRARAGARRCGAGPLPCPPCIGCKLCLRDRRVERGTEAPRRLGTRASAFLGSGRAGPPPTRRGGGVFPPPPAGPTPPAPTAPPPAVAEGVNASLLG